MRAYVKVKFKKGDKHSYTYVCDGAVEELSQFTHAVVDSPYSGLTVVEVSGFSEIDESTYNGAYKDVITLFSLDYYNEKRDRAARKQGIEKELRQLIARKIFEDNMSKLLEDDERGMQLLKEYRSL